MSMMCVCLDFQILCLHCVLESNIFILILILFFVVFTDRAGEDIRPGPDTSDLQKIFDNNTVE